MSLRTREAVASIHPTSYPKSPPERIAIVGGRDFDTAALDTFLFALREKYPGATIVTGNGQGAEPVVRTTVEMLGMLWEVPEVREDWYGKDALTCQINDIYAGADVLVVVGSPEASRPKQAIAIWKRIETCRDEMNRVPLHKIAAVKKEKATTKRKPARKRETLAV